MICVDNCKAKQREHDSSGMCVLKWDRLCSCVEVAAVILRVPSFVTILSLISLAPPDTGGSGSRSRGLAAHRA